MWPSSRSCPITRATAEVRASCVSSKAASDTQPEGPVGPEILNTSGKRDSCSTKLRRARGQSRMRGGCVAALAAAPAAVAPVAVEAAAAAWALVSAAAATAVGAVA
eukprot:279493-Chlamydomonas_euryale.AAC.1